ncbi:MAG: hypothetical protein IAE79_17260 [Anaerolinea sp.]|nr:hypothetical protein [Anaerolinea sp.]
MNAVEVALGQFEAEVNMQYVSSIERIAVERGMKRGLQQGMQQGMQQGSVKSTQESVRAVLETRFGTVPADVVAALDKIDDMELLRELLKQAVTVASLSAFAELLTSHG